MGSKVRRQICDSVMSTGAFSLLADESQTIYIYIWCHKMTQPVLADISTIHICINHSHKVYPVFKVQGKLCFGFISTKLILEGSQLFWDYGDITSELVWERTNDRQIVSLVDILETLLSVLQYIFLFVKSSEGAKRWRYRYNRLTVLSSRARDEENSVFSLPGSCCPGCKYI